MQNSREKLWRVALKFTEELPELEVAYKEHLTDYEDEPLPYIFFPDAVRDVLRQMRCGTLTDSFYKRLGTRIENELPSLRSDDPDTYDLIVLGLLTEIHNSDLWKPMRGHLGPKATDALRKYLSWKPGQA
ncbi:MAG TPA: hypothetical protein VFE35_03250 [Candidatus Cybelea sp.]|jgi:hypothetical protein|nr:hypothetical protein [Candidatus Cybelea sp.]